MPPESVEQDDDDERISWSSDKNDVECSEKVENDESVSDGVGDVSIETSIQTNFDYISIRKNLPDWICLVNKSSIVDIDCWGGRVLIGTDGGDGGE